MLGEKYMAKKQASLPQGTDKFILKAGWEDKYAEVNRKKAEARAAKKAKYFKEPEDQSHYRDIDGQPLNAEKYSSIRGVDCWYTQILQKITPPHGNPTWKWTGRWQRIPL